MTTSINQTSDVENTVDNFAYLNFIKDEYDKLVRELEKERREKNELALALLATREDRDAWKARALKAEAIVLPMGRGA